jgi:hypothetical protein
MMWDMWTSVIIIIVGTFLSVIWWGPKDPDGIYMEDEEAMSNPNRISDAEA